MDPKTLRGETAEEKRLAEDASRGRNWKRWGPYLSERQWSTVREDYSPYGNCWDYFPHDHARSRAYRWGEDGLLGITDRECRLCFALALWNGRDPILKERLFEENRRRGLDEPEFELVDTGVFDENRYFDVFVEYAKAETDDVLIRITAANRGPETATLDLLPTLWFRNSWDWGRSGEGYPAKPRLERQGEGVVHATHETLGAFELFASPGLNGRMPGMLFTDNRTNRARLYGIAGDDPLVKDAFHEAVAGDHP